MVAQGKEALQIDTRVGSLDTMTAIDQHMKGRLQQCGSDNDDAKKRPCVDTVSCGLCWIMVKPSMYKNKEAACFCEVKRNSYCSYMTYSLVVTLMGRFSEIMYSS